MILTLITIFACGQSESIRRPNNDKKCAIKKIKITGAQYYEGYHPAKEVFKSLGHFNGVYEIDGEKGRVQL